MPPARFMEAALAAGGPQGTRGCTQGGGQATQVGRGMGRGDPGEPQFVASKIYFRDSETDFSAFWCPFKSEETFAPL